MRVLKLRRREEFVMRLAIELEARLFGHFILRDTFESLVAACRSKVQGVVSF